MLAPGWFTPSPLIPQGISPALTRCSAFHMDHLTKDTKNVTLGIKAGTQAAIWWPWQPQSKMNLPYSVYGRAGGLQELVDQISPPSLFLVLKPFPDRIELKEAAGLLFLKEARRRKKVFGNQFRRVWIQLDKVSCLSLAIFKFIFLSPMLLRFYCCEDSGTETESQKDLLLSSNAQVVLRKATLVSQYSRLICIDLESHLQNLYLPAIILMPLFF